MIVIDTNVASEFMRVQPAPAVIARRGTIKPADLYLTSVTRAELAYGIAKLAPGRRRAALELAVADFLTASRDRTLPFDIDAADIYGLVRAARERAGRPISHQDAQIAAIAQVHGATVATRNVDDFEGTSVTVVNPWDAA